MAESYNDSKYTYSINELDNQMFVFEIILQKFNQKNKIIRKIKKNTSGKLITINEKIDYSNINKIIINAININNPTTEIIVDIKLDQLNKYSTFINKNIYLEFFSTSDLLECNYNIIN